MMGLEVFLYITANNFDLLLKFQDQIKNFLNLKHLVKKTRPLHCNYSQADQSGRTVPWMHQILFYKILTGIFIAGY
jgi:hypothetical protein